MVSKIKKISKKSIKSPLQLNPIIAKQVDSLIEAKKKELKRHKLATKLRKICGENYAFILFDIDTAPKPGDTMEAFNMKATWRKIIIKEK